MGGGNDASRTRRQIVVLLRPVSRITSACLRILMRGSASVGRRVPNAGCSYRDVVSAVRWVSVSPSDPPLFRVVLDGLRPLSPSGRATNRVRNLTGSAYWRVLRRVLARVLRALTPAFEQQAPTPARYPFLGQNLSCGGPDLLVV